MKFSEVNFEKIQAEGYDKLLVMKNDNLLVGGKVQNVLLHKPILDKKEVISQFGDEDIWIIKVSD